MKDRNVIEREYRTSIHLCKIVDALFGLSSGDPEREYSDSTGGTMLILIVSANPLFKEVINEVLTDLQSEVMELNVEEALNRICEIRPDVMIVDQTIEQPFFEGVLAEARNLQKTRIVVLDPIQNEFIQLDSRRSTMSKVEDLMEAISNSGFDIQPGWEDRGPSEDP